MIDFNSLILFQEGVVITLALAILALVLGLALSILMVVLLETKRLTFVLPIRGFITFMRGVPLIVQLFLIYYGSAQFEWLQNSVLWPLFQEPFFCATLALALNSAAYTTVLLEGSIASIPIGEKEASKVLGLSFYTHMRHIILPRALKGFWPAYSNEIIMVVKSTSLVSTITLMDLMGVTRQIISQTYKPLEALMISGILYLLLNGLLTLIFSSLFNYREFFKYKKILTANDS